MMTNDDVMPMINNDADDDGDDDDDGGVWQSQSTYYILDTAVRA